MRKAQFAMEYLLVIGFSLVILLPSIALLYNEYDKNRTDIYVEHAAAAGQEIIHVAEEIYYRGAPSRTTLELSLPPNIASITASDQLITLIFTDTSIPLYLESRVPVEITFTPFGGPHRLVLAVKDHGSPHDPLDDFVVVQEG